MIRILPILTILFFFSCGSDSNKQKTEPNDKEIAKKDSVLIEKDVNRTIENLIIFQSGPNGLADIKLTIIPNGEFEYFMQTIPQPMTDDEVTTINSTGKWTKKDNWVQLVFDKDKPILSAVFDINYADNNQFKIIDTNTVEINIDQNGIYIWGIDCKKEYLNKTTETDYDSYAKILQYFITETDSINSQLISGNCVVLIYPTEQQIISEKEKIDEEDFYTVTDDNNFHMSNLIELMKNLDIKTITSKKRILKFQGEIEDYIVNLDKQNEPELPYYNAILFNKKRNPIFIEIVDLDEEKMINYMK
jgi:hypothetical protein